MIPKNTIKINGEKLRNAFVRRGIKYVEAGKALGRSSNYIPNKIEREMVMPADLNLFDRMFGVKPEEYVVPDEPEDEPEEIMEDSKQELPEEVVQALKAIVKNLEDIGRCKMAILEEMKNQKEEKKNQSVALCQKIERLYNFLKYERKSQWQK